MNIFTNSSVAFFVRKVGASKLLAQACIWIFITSTVGVGIFYFIETARINASLLIFLLISSLLTGYLTFHSALYIGLQKIKYFNLLTILQPLFLLIFIFLLFYTKETTYFDYFYAHIFSLIFVILIAYFLSGKTIGKIKLQLDFSVTKQTFSYGFQNELSNFFQLLASRLSFYFIIYYLSEISVGVFSMGVAISESIFTISRSVSTVQYSKIIKEGNTQNARKAIVTASLFSLVFSLFCVIILLVIPNTIYTSIWGDEFFEVKQIIFLMSPGILCTAFSTVLGHYFAAIGKQKILILKSVTGAILTVILSVTLIPEWGMNGASISSSIMRFFSGAIIVVYFFMINDRSRNKIVEG
jgi:O-antigen/teichoic acid export membrane protein